MRAIATLGILIALSPAALLAAPPAAINHDGSVLIAEGKGPNQGNQGQGNQGQGNQGQGNQGQGQGQDNKGGPRNFSGDHRDIIIGYYQQNYYGRGNCPPGLAKKNNGCLPPGQAKKYAVGQQWPSHLVWQPLPGPLLTRMGPPPSGYGYGYYEGDVIMYALVGKVVVDIVSTLGR